VVATGANSINTKKSLDVLWSFASLAQSDLDKEKQSRKRNPVRVGGINKWKTQRNLVEIELERVDRVLDTTSKIRKHPDVIKEATEKKPELLRRLNHINAQIAKAGARSVDDIEVDESDLEDEDEEEDGQKFEPDDADVIEEDEDDASTPIPKKNPNKRAVLKDDDEEDDSTATTTTTTIRSIESEKFDDHIKSAIADLDKRLPGTDTIATKLESVKDATPLFYSWLLIINSMRYGNANNRDAWIALNGITDAEIEAIENEEPPVGPGYSKAKLVVFSVVDKLRGFAKALDSYTERQQQSAKQQRTSAEAIEDIIQQINSALYI